MLALLRSISARISVLVFVLGALSSCGRSPIVHAASKIPSASDAASDNVLTTAILDILSPLWGGTNLQGFTERQLNDRQKRNDCLRLWAQREIANPRERAEYFAWFKWYDARINEARQDLKSAAGGESEHDKWWSKVVEEQRQAEILAAKLKHPPRIQCQVP